jgi:hypothetical protein
MEHLKVLPTQITLKTKKEIGQKILDNRIIVTIGQLLKLAPNVNMYLTTISKQLAFNEGITTKAIIIITIVVVDHQMVVILVHVKKNMVDDVLLDGRLGLNAITNGLKQKLRLPPPQLAPFNLLMADFSFMKPLGIVPNIKIRIHGVLYIVTFIMMNNKAMDPTYSMLLGRPWLWDTKMVHDWGPNMVTIEGNGTIKIVSISKYLNGNIKRPQMVINYNFIKGVTDEEEKIMFFSKRNLVSVGMTTFLD